METQNYEVFYVEQTADVTSGLLTAFGWAEVLKAMTGGDVEINSRGYVYEVRPEYPLDEESWQNAFGLGQLWYIEKKSATTDKKPENDNDEPDPDEDAAVNSEATEDGTAEEIKGKPGKKAKKKASKLAEPRPSYITRWLDYDHERAKKFEVIQARKANPTLYKSNQAQDESGFELVQAHPMLSFAEFVVQMKGPITTYNNIVSRWAADEAYWLEYIRMLAECFSTFPNDLSGLDEKWRKLAKEKKIAGKSLVTALQIFTPTAGKGGDAAKANGLSVGQKDIFWLICMLQIRGMEKAGLPMTVKGNEDRKTYVAIPARLMMDTHTRIWEDFTKSLIPAGPIKMDVQAALRYTVSFVRQHQSGLAYRTVPANFVSGLMVAHYKDLGSAKALINLSQLNLPNWIMLDSSQTAQQYLAILREHETVIAFLDHKRGNEYELLSLYREFLSGRTLQPFFEFAGAYASILMKRLESGSPAPQFSTLNLEVLIMAYAKNDQSEDQSAPNPSEVIANTGFNNIATAIRLSTIVPQRQKAQKKRPLYEVRYGLGEELRRKAAYRDEFIDALTDFVYSYNQETMQKLERTGQQRRKLVTRTDLDALIELLKDNRHSRVIGGMLVAYGYARDPQEGDRESQSSDTAENTHNETDSTTEATSIEVGEFGEE